jgi:FHS family L-fucose permease-like MFS transporter
MFPTIFSLGVKDLGGQTKRASSYMVAAIVGGAVLPYVMGIFAEHTSTALAYLFPTGCFSVVALYAWRGYRVR